MTDDNLTEKLDKIIEYLYDSHNVSTESLKTVRDDFLNSLESCTNKMLNAQKEVCDRLEQPSIVYEGETRYLDTYKGTEGYALSSGVAGKIISVAVGNKAIDCIAEVPIEIYERVILVKGTDTEPKVIPLRTRSTGVVTPEIFNVSISETNKEYEQAIPDGTVKISMQCRTSVDVRHSYETGKVGTPTAPYSTMKADNVYYEDGLNTKNLKIYLASSTGSIVVEIITWR